MILRKLSVTIAVLLVVMFAFNYLVLNRTHTAVNAPVVNENVESGDTASDSINDLGDVLDGVSIDFAA